MFGFWKVVPADSPSNQTDNAGTSAAPKDDASTSGDHTVEPVASPTPNDGTGPIHEPPKAEEVNNDIAFPRAASPVNNPDTSDDTAANPSALAPEVPRRARRISFRSFGFFYGREKVAPILPKDEEETIEPEIVTTAPESQKKVPKREIRKVEKAALVLRSFLLGPGGIQPSSSSAKSSKGKKTAALKQPNQNKLNKVNGQMLTPDKANKVIAKLRTLPVPDGPEIPGVEFAGERIVSHAEGPIHAVCLDCTEEEAEKYHFSHLAGSSDKKFKTEAVTGDPPSIASANLATLIPVLREMRIITLVTSPDLGFSQPLGGEGLLAGAIPSAENTGTGMLEITSQILALGFATSNAIYPNHSGIYPPTDRMSVLSYWWGFEVCLPPPTISYLEKVKSIQNAALNLLTAFSLFNNGVREILPFVRYISQFLDFEWTAIKAQNKGNGVVCAATWICPAALVPRPWDFKDPPPGQALSIPPKQAPFLGGPTLALPGSSGGVFTPTAPEFPAVMITPATLPRGVAKVGLLRKT